MAGVEVGVDTIKSVAVLITTVTASAGGVWGVLRLITKTQRDFVNTASKRNSEQELSISSLKEEAAAAETAKDEVEAVLRATERKYQETWLDRAELVRLLETHNIPVPSRIKKRTEKNYG